MAFNNKPAQAKSSTKITFNKDGSSTWKHTYTGDSNHGALKSLATTKSWTASHGAHAKTK